MKTKTSLILCILMIFCVSFSPKSNKQHTIGELYGDGIIFFVDKNGTHGLIASLNDVNNDIPWASKQSPVKEFPSKPKYIIDNTKLTLSSDVDGEYNTKMIIESGYANSAAWFCTIYSSGSNHDWYLPSIDELKKLISSKTIINGVISKINNKDFDVLSDSYWSSTNTELKPDGTWAYKTDFKLLNMHDNYLNVRAIRKF